MSCYIIRYAILYDFGNISGFKYIGGIYIKLLMQLLSW